MMPVNYDEVAESYDRRYARQSYDGVARALIDFVGDAGSVDALDVGCGTGHWLRLIARHVASAVGVDRSWEMLQRAHAAAPGVSGRTGQPYSERSAIAGSTRVARRAGRYAAANATRPRSKHAARSATGSAGWT